jgi:hypothetical protein
MIRSDNGPNYQSRRFRGTPSRCCIWPCRLEPLKGLSPQIRILPVSGCCVWLLDSQGFASCKAGGRPPVDDPRRLCGHLITITACGPLYWIHVIGVCLSVLLIYDLGLKSAGR